MSTLLKYPEDIGTARHEDDVAALLTQRQQRPVPQTPIAFYGSSSFRLWQRMAQDLNSLDVVNLGFGGGTNASGLYHIDTLLTPLRPARIALYFGENDISADGLSAQSTFSHMRSLHQAIRQRLGHVPMFILSAKQSLTKWIYADVVSEYNQLLNIYCQDEASTHYVDVTTVLLGEHGRPIGRYFENDLIHLNAAGYQQWARILRSQQALWNVTT